MKDYTFNGFYETHIHTRYSDGVFTDDGFIQKIGAIRNNGKKALKVIALTDHDSLNGYEPICRAAENDPDILNGVEIIPGIEFTTEFNGKECHILGYFSEFDPGKLNKFLREPAERVITWNEQRLLDPASILGILIEHCDILGIELRVDAAEAEKEARYYYKKHSERLHDKKKDDEVFWKANVSRNYVRKSLEKQTGISEKALQVFTIRKHSAGTNMEILKNYYAANCKKNHHLLDELVEKSTGKILYERIETLSPLSAEEAVKTINDAGGSAVFAHPGETELYGIDLGDKTALGTGLGNIAALKKCGLKGVEAFYPSHKNELSQILVEFCQRENLVVCGGSDWHGKTEEQHARFGMFSPDSMLKDLGIE